MTLNIYTMIAERPEAQTIFIAAGKAEGKTDARAPVVAELLPTGRPFTGRR